MNSVFLLLLDTGVVNLLVCPMYQSFRAYANVHMLGFPPPTYMPTYVLTLHTYVCMSYQNPPIHESLVLFMLLAET